MGVTRLTFPCDDLETLMRAFYAEHRIAGVSMPLNEAKARAYIHAYLQNGVVFGEYADGEIVGSIALGEAPFWWTDVTAMWDGWFFVDPRFRTGGVALRLIKAAKAYADETGKRLVIGISDTNDLGRKVAFLEHHGFRQAGAQLLYGAA